VKVRRSGKITGKVDWEEERKNRPRYLEEGDSGKIKYMICPVRMDPRDVIKVETSEVEKNNFSFADGLGAFE